MTWLLPLLLPSACAGCGRMGAVLCRNCTQLLLPASDARDAFIIQDPGRVVGESLLLGLAAFQFDGTTRRALSRLKYSGMRLLAAPLADAASSALGRLLQVTGPAALTPVPIHPSRQRERGYNQAALLAHRLARTAHLELHDILERQSMTERQHRLDRASRIKNLRGAIAVRPGARLPPRIIVVDDILTTAATLEACATVLLGAGVAEVYGFAIAREL